MDLRPAQERKVFRSGGGTRDSGCRRLSAAFLYVYIEKTFL